jgi:hypothetical protein
VRTATAIIAIISVFILGGQTCLATCAAGLIGYDEVHRAGAIGFLVAFLFIIGGALVIGFPFISFITFSIAGILCLVNALTSIYTDMYVWGGLALILAFMSYLGHRKSDSATAWEAGSRNTGNSRP